MTLHTLENKIVYVADGIVDTFAYDFRVDYIEDMYVYFGDVVQTTGWSMTGLGVPEGGDVIFVTPPPAETTVTLIRILPLVQETDYKPYDPFPAETHELDLDKIIMICQQLQESIHTIQEAIIIAGSKVWFSESTVVPTTPGQGDWWYQTDVEKLYLYYEGTWIDPIGSWDGVDGKDGAYKGDTIIANIADAATVKYDIIYLRGDWYWELANAGDTVTCQIAAMALEDGDGLKRALIRGIICNHSWEWGASGPLYLHTVDGEMSLSKPTGSGQAVHTLGWAKSQSTVIFDPTKIVLTLV